MSGAEEIAEIAAEGVADAMHIVSEEALAAEEVVRGLQRVNLAYLALGFAAGAAAGGFAAWRIAYRKADAKYAQIAAEEIAEMQEHFHAKEVARENEQAKGGLAEIVRERGYVPDDDEDEEPVRSAEPPMAVSPPSSVVERADEAREEEAETPPPPEEDEEPRMVNVFEDHAVRDEADVWDWAAERAQRSPLRPYVIHRDERDEQVAYASVTFTYYEADDVVCNERDEVLDKDEREQIIGEVNLEKFGHGSGDPVIVYVRNPKLEMDMEVVRSPNSYLAEVIGIEHDEPEIRHSARRSRQGRAKFDDE